MAGRALLVVAVLCISRLAIASGLPDTSFGENGALILDLDRNSPPDDEEAKAVLIDAHGRYVVAGVQYCDQPCVPGGTKVTGFVGRYLANGAPDPSFHGGAAVFLDSPEFSALKSFELYAYDVIEQPDRKLLVGGSRWEDGVWSSFICRLLENGSVDSEFAETGCREFAQIDGKPGLNGSSDMALQNDGRILILGAPYDFNDQRSYMLVRLMSDGTFDHSFGGVECPNCGWVWSPEGLGNAMSVGSVALDPQGRIVIAGSVYTPFRGLAAVRLKNSGEFDQGLNVLDFSSFVGGEAVHSLLGVQVLPDGSVHVLGTAESNAKAIAVGKVSSDGIPDATFGNGGRVAIDYDDSRALGIQSDGKFLFAGEDAYAGCSVTRVNPKDGSVDGHFGTAGRTDFLPWKDALNNCRPSALVSDGKHILVAGRVFEGAMGDDNMFDDNENALLFRLEQDLLFGDGFEE